MPRRSASLRSRHPRRIDIPVLLVLSAALIGAGLLLPAVETRALFWRNEHSILLNVQQMSREGKQVAATILALCSIGYPAVKIGLLSFFWMFPFPATWRWRSIQLIRLLGRWGMVDVMAMTSIVVASLTIGPLRATPRMGLFLFAAGMLCLMFTGLLMDRLARTR
jgi:paraquat-inducible protein A